MKQKISVVVGALLFGALCPAALAKLNVVATTPDFGAIAIAIGGDEVTVTTLAKPTEDPHFVDAKPSFIVRLNRADALVEGGAELEIGWLPALLDQARNTKLAAGAPEPSFDSTNGPLKLCRGLLIGLALKIAENQRQAVAVWQAVQFLVEDRTGDDLG